MKISWLKRQTTSAFKFKHGGIKTVLLGTSLPKISIHKKALKTVETLNTWLLQSCAKCFEKDLEMKESYTKPNDFYICFWVSFESKHQRFISPGETGSVPSSFEIFFNISIFP